MSEYDDLRGRKAALEIDPEQFRMLGHRLVDQIAELMGGMRDRKVTAGAPPQVIREKLETERPLPESGTEASEVLEKASERLFEYSLYNGHPKFWGYITSSPAPIGVLGDLLASSINPNVGGWLLSPAASEVEVQTVRWIAEFMGFPADGSGVLVSGGNTANFVGLLAARAAKATWDVREKGLRSSEGRQMRIYASAETHTWLEKSADMYGFGREAVRFIETDGSLRMDVEKLREAIERDTAAGDQPFVVIGTAGSVSTGAVDPLDDVAEICREYDLWFHVDGAYGGLAAGVPGYGDELAGLRNADSVAVDPHKWLYAPLEAGCALVRDPEALQNAFSYHPPYYHFEEEAVNFVDCGPQNSRGFRALKVWLALKQVGRSGYERMIRDDIRLAEALYKILDGYEDIERFTHSLSIATFRYVPKDLRDQKKKPSVQEYLNELNREILDRIEYGGEAFVSNAVLDGTYVLRACVVNFRTTLEDIEALPDIVLRVGVETDTEMRREKNPV